MKREDQMHHVPFFLLAGKLNPNLVGMCLQSGIADVFTRPLVAASIEKRINFVINNWDKLHRKNDKKNVTVTRPDCKEGVWYFLFQLRIALPFPGAAYRDRHHEAGVKRPVFYYSLRVGTGYKVFKFYKFRSMYVNADKRLKELQHLNQYNSADKPAGAKEKWRFAMSVSKKGSVAAALFMPMAIPGAKNFISHLRSNRGSAFLNLRTIRVSQGGRLHPQYQHWRAAAIVECAEGNMSIVGNRPLPLYEAEKLTTDKYALRFLAPAGLTGCAGREKGKGKMSEEERLMLDNTYAENHSFWYDIKLILKTFPHCCKKKMCRQWDP